MRMIFVYFLVITCVQSEELNSMGSFTRLILDREQEVRVVEDGLLSLQCPPGQVLIVSGAVYVPRGDQTPELFFNETSSNESTGNGCFYPQGITDLIQGLCDEREFCEVDVSDSVLLTDPVGCDKSRNELRVRFECLTEYDEGKVVVCEGHRDVFDCNTSPHKPLIGIEWAWYGRLDWTTCVERPGQATRPECGWHYTEKYRNECNGQTTCEVISNNFHFGWDTCPFNIKYVTILYRCYRDTLANREMLEAQRG